MFEQYYYNPMNYFIASCLLFCAGCTSTKYVTVPEIHEVHHHHTDSVHQIDSVINDRETIVMMLDSQAMEQYGIRLQAAERAFLVKVRELEREIQIVREEHTDTVLKIDSVPKPYPVEVTKEVKKPLTWWQQTRLHLANVMLILLGLYVIWKVIKNRTWWMAIIKRLI